MERVRQLDRTPQLDGLHGNRPCCCSSTPSSPRNLAWLLGSGLVGLGLLCRKPFTANLAHGSKLNANKPELGC